MNNNKKVLYKKGEILRMVRVRFPGQTKPQSFLLGDLPFKYGEKVVALSERGMTVGYIHSFPFEVAYESKLGEVRFIERYASEEDILKYKESYQEQREAKKIFVQLVEDLQLNMTLKDAEFSGFGKKVTFYFTAPTRVDFRELLIRLNKQLRLKIDLRQIPEGSGDLSDIGPCGPELCQFINSLMESDCTNNKKCNEFKCRLDYKDPFYEDKRSRLPKVGDIITTHTNELGRVERLDLWNEEFEMLTDQGVLKKYVSELWKETLKKNTVDFPKSFERIVHENKMVIGRS